MQTVDNEKLLKLIPDYVVGDEERKQVMLEQLAAEWANRLLAHIDQRINLTTLAGCYPGVEIKPGSSSSLGEYTVLILTNPQRQEQFNMVFDLFASPYGADNLFVYANNLDDTTRSRFLTQKDGEKQWFLASIREHKDTKSHEWIADTVLVLNKPSVSTKRS